MNVTSIIERVLAAEELEPDTYLACLDAEGRPVAERGRLPDADVLATVFKKAQTLWSKVGFDRPLNFEITYCGPGFAVFARLDESSTLSVVWASPATGLRLAFSKRRVRGVAARLLDALRSRPGPKGGAPAAPR